MWLIWNIYCDRKEEEKGGRKGEFRQGGGGEERRKEIAKRFCSSMNTVSSIFLLRLLSRLSPSSCSASLSSASYELSLQNWWLWTPSISSPSLRSRTRSPPPLPLFSSSHTSSIKKTNFTHSSPLIKHLLPSLLPTLRRCHHRRGLPSRPGHPFINAARCVL